MSQQTVEFPRESFHIIAALVAERARKIGMDVSLAHLSEDETAFVAYVGGNRYLYLWIKLNDLVTQLTVAYASADPSICTQADLYAEDLIVYAKEILEAFNAYRDMRLRTRQASPNLTGGKPVLGKPTLGVK